VLDIGCGVGDYLQAYKGKSAGIDSNPPCVNYCQSLGLNVTLGDAHNFPVARRFDSVLLSCVLEHVDHPTQVLEHADQALKSKGRMVLVLPCMAGFIQGLNDWHQHKQHVTAEYVDRCLVRSLGYRRLRKRIFPPVDLPIMQRYREVRCVYEKP
jgi:SAM-dependent methyltransferase